MRLPLFMGSDEEEISSDGWVKQFTASEPRLSEMRLLFESLGKEVRFEKEENITQEEVCEACIDARSDVVWTIWTREEIDTELDKESEYVRTSDREPIGLTQYEGVSVNRTITSHKSDSILVIEINNPPVNIVDSKVIEALLLAFEQAEADLDCRAVIITGAGNKGFSAGASIEEHLPDQAPAMIEGMTVLLECLERTPLLTLAAIHGICLGGGAEVALACDLIIATDDCKIGIPEITVGCYPPFAMLQLPSMVGMRRAKQMILSGTPISGSQAEKIGLVNNCTTYDSLMDESLEMLASILSNPPQIVEVALRKLRSLDIQSDRTTHRVMGEGFLEDLVKHPDYIEGLTAFLEKRNPEWQPERPPFKERGD